MKQYSENNFEQCTKCTVCTTYCPVAAVNPLYPGPKHSGPDGERLRLKSPQFFDESLNMCLNCKRCEVACPSDVRIGDIIQSARIKYSAKKPGLREFTLANTDLVGSVATLAAPVVKASNETSTAIKVSWGKVSGAQKYYVYRKAGSAKSWTKVKTTTSTSYTDKNVKNGTTYKYMVKAIDGSIISGYNSSGISIKRLAAPTPSSVTSSKSGVTFKWGKVSGVSGYYVYRKTGTGSYKKIATVKGYKKVSYLDKSAKKGKTYTYMVKAYSGSTTSAYRTGLKIKDKY